jgi:Asp-tRNA(Asn)/Glu-tRNA(Gln) amidotransferase A subunit family amidase
VDAAVTLAQLSRAVRERRASAVEVVRTSLERVERLNPDLNAVIATRPEQALAEAEALDARIADGEDPGPLAGVPLLVKDNERLTGMRTTHGSELRRNLPPEEADGLVPARLRAAGAIAIGKTNVPEFTFAGYTTNTLVGTTVNPWNPAFSPGGSSGGSAAAMAAGMAPLATATDGGGSIRIPASFCGLAGLKPTNGVIARDPIPAWIDLSTYGPLGPRSPTCLLLELERGPAPGDPTALPVPLPLQGPMPSRVFAAGRIVEYDPLPPAIEALFAAALTSVDRGLGLPVERLDHVLSAGDPYDDWFVQCAYEHLHLLGRETVAAVMHRFSPDFRDAMESALRIEPHTYMAARRRRFDYCRELDLLLGEDAVLLTPTMTLEGWAPDGIVPGTDRAADGPEGYNCEPFNLTGHPALTVPAGASPNGVPFGLQIVAPRFRDDLALTFGRAWEAENPWPMSAPGYEPFPTP